MKQTRREFMGTLSVGSLAMMNISGRAASSGGDNGSATSFVTLFQGDSITDGNRGRTHDPNHILGHGYASHVASTLGALHPERNLSFLNRGISGDTVASLQARWKSDALALRPDVISLLIGVNDILHRIKSGTTKKPSSYYAGTHCGNLRRQTSLPIPFANAALSAL